MANFAMQGTQGQHPLFGLLQMLLNAYSTPQAQAMFKPQTQQPQLMEMPQAQNMFTPPKPPTPNLMQPAGSFVGQNGPEMKAITAMKPPANPWLLGGK